MCEQSYSESGARLTPARCADYIALASDRDRLAGVVAGMEEQNSRNLDALRRAEERVTHLEMTNYDYHQGVLNGVSHLLTKLIRGNRTLRKALEFYAKDDANAVECGILGSVDDRPATNALKEVGQ